MTGVKLTVGGLRPSYAEAILKRFPELAPMFWEQGDTIEHIRSGDRKVLKRRKDDNSGWWLLDGGGLWDKPAAAEWRKVEKP